MLGFLLVALMATGPRDADLHVASKRMTGSRAELLDAGANVNSRDALGATPLHDAAWNGYQICPLLIERHADVNARHLEAAPRPALSVIKDERKWRSCVGSWR